MIKGIICFGDSVIFGVGASSRSHGCCRILQASVNIPVAIRGRNNDTSINGLSRLQRDVLSLGQEQHVIILFGNNDCRLIGIDKPIVSISDYKKNLSIMIERIRTNRQVPILSTLQPISNEVFLRTFTDMKNLLKNITSPYEWHQRYSEAVKEVALSTVTPVVDIRFALLNATENILSTDGLHPNDVGHKIIGKEFRRSVFSC